VLAQSVTPFFTTNHSPVIQIHGLPAVDRATVLSAGHARYRLMTDLASNYTQAEDANEEVLFDGETTRTTFTYARGVGGGWEWGLQIPYLNHDGGVLDTFIENWHRFFGLPQNGRLATPQNRLLYRYRRNGVTQFNLTDQTAGIGDIRLTGARQWRTAVSSDATNIALRASLSLPSGDSDALRGSGAAELALWFSADRAASWFALPATTWGGAGILLMGKGDVLPDQQRRGALFGSVGTGLRVLPWMTLKLQLDAQTALYGDSSLTQINANAMQLLIGGDLQLVEDVMLTFAVSEDITVHASSDVVFQLGLTVVR
jgi:hypothetical protein